MNNVQNWEESHRFIRNLNGKTKFSVSKNSRAMGLSRQTYQNKLDILREKKIITNFTININPDINPNNLKYVILEIKTNPKEPNLVEELIKIPQLRMLDGIFGDFSLFGLLIFKSPEDYYHTLNIIDNVMAKSYFKKYQIIETIKVFKTNGISLRKKKSLDVDFEVDAIDYIILNILRDCQSLKPISTYEIRNIFQKEHQIEISQSTIHNRVKRLEEKGVILNYTINFHPKKIGYEGKFLLRIKPRDPSKYDELATKLDMNNDITDLFRIGEQYGLFAIVRVKKIGDYATFLRNLYGSEDIEDTYTNFVLDELITHTNFVIL